MWRRPMPSHRRKRHAVPFTAKLQVSNTNPFALVKEDPYLLKIEDDTQDARINIAIDKGLWWSHTQAVTTVIRDIRTPMTVRLS